MSNYQPTDDSFAARSGWHPTHVTHLVFGLLFIGLVSVWAAFQTGLVESSDTRWLIPLPWVLAGGAGLVAAAMSNRRTAPVSVPEHAGTSFAAEPLWEAADTDPTVSDQEIR
ncbi:MAG: hypothetical protein V9F00_10625 [Nocardioides sp.]|jgi:hypothetical protein